jgi:mevalonate kinase
MSKCFGKIIISGEHAAVYGKLALAASIGLGVTAKVLGEGGESNQSVVLTKAIEVAGQEGLTSESAESGARL